MPAAVRKGDKDTGHGCFPPRPNIAGSSSVMINNKPAHRKGDKWDFHSCPKNPPHDGTTTAGSSNISIGGQPAARVGDSISCGGACAVGSSNIFFN